MAQVLGIARDWLAVFTVADLLGLGVTALVMLILVLAVRRVIPALLSRLSHRLGWEYEDTVWPRLVVPLWMLVALLGVWALLVQMPVPDAAAVRYHRLVAVGISVLLTILVVMGLIRLTNALAEHYRGRLREAQDPRATYVGAIRKITDIVLMVLGLMLVLGQLGYQIGPLMASLGVAGIAVALATKDTLGNLFAGLYLALDQPIRPGDYIKLDSGVEGFVEEVGWRNTRMRVWQNNIVLVPNEKLADSIITNWYLPDREMSVYIWCGVGYGSDLRHVEKVCIEVGEQVMAEVAGSALDWTPVVRYKEFGDSNITFVLTLRVSDPTISYLLQHECVKALHERFRQEDIEISWPVTKVVWEQPPTLPT